MKITTSFENINSFGGLNFISDEYDRLNFRKTTTYHLGSRSLLATYQYSDIIKNIIIKNIWMILFAGGDCAEDIHTNLKSELCNSMGMNVSSPDTILRLQKELCPNKEIHLSKAKVINEFSKNERLNELNLAVLLLTNQLKKGSTYDLDFDNQFIPCKKYDSKKSYKMKNGYFPAIATIGKNIIYLENRNGNSNVKFKQEQTLQRVYDLLACKEVKIKRSRMDCGSFTKEVIKVVEENSELFYIRAQKCSELTSQIRGIENWKKTTVGNKEVEVASLNSPPLKDNKSYRYVVSREASKNKQIDLFQQDHFIYRAIITNDIEMTYEEVVEY